MVGMFLYIFDRNFHLYFQCIVHGLIGVNGQGVLSLVEEDHKKEEGMKKSVPNMVETNVLAITQQDNLVIMKNVLV